MTVQSIEHDKSKGRVMRAACHVRGTTTDHIALTSIDLAIGFMPSSPNGFMHYQIIQCMGCRDISFRQFTKFPDPKPDSPSRRTKKWETDEQLFPRRNIERSVIRQAYELPEDIRRIYQETHQALLGNQPVLAGIGLRAILETICKERSAPGKDLRERIDNLTTLGLLTKGNADFLHSLRILGNQAAHEVIPHGKEKLNIAMDVIEHLLVTVYILPLKAGKLK